MKIRKLFVQKYISSDCEARHWEWVTLNFTENIDKTYKELKEELGSKWDGWFEKVRIVEKTFDDESFVITVKPIITAERAYKNSTWKKNEIKETVG